MPLTSTIAEEAMRELASAGADAAHVGATADFALTTISAFELAP